MWRYLVFFELSMNPWAFIEATGQPEKASSHELAAGGAMSCRPLM
jgi:hypothetical protein